MRKIGTYQIVRPLVSNRSIHSFEALDLRLGRRVVLLFPNLHQAGNAQVTPFLHGAPTVTALRHPNIARVYELGMENGLPCIITEPVQGIEIDALVRAEPSPGAEWKVHVVNQICEALAHAHSRHVIHLDIRPANVFATPAGDVKVMGFGAAPLRAAGVEKAAIGIDDVLYMAPEQIVADNVDHRADIFSTGALAYELFSGCQPFAGGSPQEVLDKIQNQRPDPALLPETEYSPRLEAILMKALAQNPDDRYQRIEEMQKAMDDLLRNSVDAFFERMLQAESPSSRPASDHAGSSGSTADHEAGAGSRLERVQVLYTVALGQAAEGRLEEASKLAKAIRLLAPDDPRNDEMTAYLLVEAETAVQDALASSRSGPRARALRHRLERLRAAHGNAGPHPPRHEPRHVTLSDSSGVRREKGKPPPPNRGGQWSDTRA